MRIYTRQGDKGETVLPGGKRVPKYHPLVQNLGELDECMSALGVAAAYACDPLKAELHAVQAKLLAAGTDLAAQGSSHKVERSDVQWLEGLIDRHSQCLPPLREFIVPGGTPLAAHLHLARAVTRRWERGLAGLERTDLTDVQAFANRLSDYLFCVARYVAETDREAGSSPK